MPMRHFALSIALLTIIALPAQETWTLEQCVKRAQERNLDVRNAALDADLADKVHEQAYWSFLPNLNGAATHGYNWGKTIDQYTNTFATDRVRTNNLYLNSDVTLFQGGRKQQELKQTALDEQAAGEKAWKPRATTSARPWCVPIWTCWACWSNSRRRRPRPRPPGSSPR
jgi:outer membrane protein TolC